MIDAAPSRRFPCKVLYIKRLRVHDSRHHSDRDCCEHCIWIIQSQQIRIILMGVAMIGYTKCDCGGELVALHNARQRSRDRAICFSEALSSGLDLSISSVLDKTLCGSY